MSEQFELPSRSLGELSPNQPTSNAAFSNKAWLILLALLATGGLLRLLCSFNDLWFDEIISVELASRMTGWHGIFSEFRYDNNHYLNTAWVYMLGPNCQPYLYRIPAVIAGIAIIPVIYWVLKPYGRYSQITAAILFACSHAQIHYSSEARGYAFQILFAFAAFGFIDRYHRSNKTAMAIGFGVCSSLALLSHLLTLHFLMAIGLWSLSFHTSQKIPFAKQVLRVAVCMGLPLLTALFLYFTHVKNLEVGGGPKYNTVLVATSAWSLVIGIVNPGWVRIFCGVAAILVTAMALRLHWRRESHIETSSQSWKFLFLFLFLVPFARILIPNSLLYTRYFLMQIAFALMLLSIVAGYILETASVRERPKWKNLFTIAFGLIVILNLYSSVRLLSHGRGSYRAALQTMTADSDINETSIASTDRTLDEPVIDYYRDDTSLKEHKIVVWQLEEQPDWIIVHRTMDSAAWQEPILDSIDNHGTNYQLQFVSKASYLSGFQWSCYKRQP